VNNVSDIESESDYSVFAELLQRQAEKKLPPVTRWNPARKGSIDILIDQDGRWLHEGQEIQRKELIQLFSSILRFENGTYYLVTPAEKLAIEVQDAPFLAIDMEIRESPQGQQIGFLTNVGDFVMLDESHPLSVEEGRPYVLVRDGLKALISRSIYYHLVQIAVPSDSDPNLLGVSSNGCFFVLGPRE